MRGAVSPGTGRPYPLTMICAVWRVSRSTVYQAMAPGPVAPVIRAKRILGRGTPQEPMPQKTLRALSQCRH